MEQVAGHVSRTTLANMQQLWRSHSTAMDGKGKQFAETVYSLHAQSIKVWSLSSCVLQSSWSELSRGSPESRACLRLFLLLLI